MKRKTYINLLILLCSTLIVLLISEFAYRGVVCVRKGSCKPLYIASRELGWVYTPYIKENGVSVTDFSGNVYSKSHESFKYGFRAWGDVKSTDKRKFFIIGDSFTEAHDVSNEHTYYSVFKKELEGEVEIFAYGGAGYGSLQEFMIIDRHIDEIAPQVVILQFCSNDFTNNSFEAENDILAKNQTIRPYLRDSKVVYRYSAWHPYPFMLRHSRLFAFLDVQVQIFRTKYKLGFNKNLSITGLKRDKHITSKLMAMIRERVPGETALYTFTCRPASESRDLYDAFYEVTTDNGFIVIEGVMDKVTQAERAGEAVRAIDGWHLNNLGNELIGKRLAQYFKDAP